MTASEAETAAPPPAKRCPVCGLVAGECDGTVCNPRDEVQAILDDLKLRLGVDIEAEADAEMSAHFAEVRGPQVEEATDAIARWFRAVAKGGQRGARPSCPNCGGWLYVDVDVDETELHAQGTREVVCLCCARRWYLYVARGRTKD